MTEELRVIPHGEAVRNAARVEWMRLRSVPELVDAARWLDAHGVVSSIEGTCLWLSNDAGVRFPARIGQRLAYNPSTRAFTVCGEEHFWEEHSDIAEVGQATEPRTAQAADKPCELYAHSNSPIPSRTQGHHRHPVYLQNRVYGEIRDPELLWLCGLCHDSVHDVIGWLLGESREPYPMPGRNAIAEAKRTVAWYQLNLPVVQAQKEAHRWRP